MLREDKQEDVDNSSKRGHGFQGEADCWGKWQVQSARCFNTGIIHILQGFSPIKEELMYIQVHRRK